MRLLALAGLLTLVAGCKRDTDATPPPAPKPQVKKPVDKTPLPPLAADRGSTATGAPLWATGFGGVGIDAPRAVATAPGGESYVVGYFDGEIDLGPAGKRKAATANLKEGKEPQAPTKPTSDAFVVKLGG